VTAAVWNEEIATSCPIILEELVEPSQLIGNQVGSDVFICGDLSQTFEVEVVDQAEAHISTPEMQQLLPPESQRQQLSRRVSYEEVVHPETEIVEDAVTGSEQDQKLLLTPSCDSNKLMSEELNLDKCLSVLTQWAICLQEVYEDRQEGQIKASSTNCLCQKADHIAEDLRKVQQEFIRFLENTKPNVSDFPIVALGEALRSIQDLLRAVVSIRISTPSPKAQSKAMRLVQDLGDVSNYVKDTIQTLIQLVYDLLNVSECPKHLCNDIRYSQ
jgi:hypothetical protein